MVSRFEGRVALIGAPDGIRVNVICPGPVDTPVLPPFFGREPGADVQDRRWAGSPVSEA